MANDSASRAPRVDPRRRARDDAYRTYHEPSGSADLTTTLVHALADVMGTDVSDVEFVLYDVIDPDAVERVFVSTGGGAPAHLAFTVEGYRVTVYSDGEIVISPPVPDAPLR